MAKKQKTAIAIRPFGMKPGDDADRFQPKQVAGLVVITDFTEQRKYSRPPSEATVAYIRRTESAKSGALLTVGRQLVR